MPEHVFSILFFSFAVGILFSFCNLYFLSFLFFLFFCLYFNLTFRLFVVSALIPFRQGICSSHLTLCLTLNFIFDYCSRACPDLKNTVYSFCCSRDHDVMGEEYLLTKPIKFDLNGKRILCWSIFGIESIAGFGPFMGYWPPKNALRYHGIKDEFVSLAKSIVLSTIGKIILRWSILALKSIANFCLLLGYWTSKDGSRDHHVKGNMLHIQNLWYLLPLGR